MDAGLAVAGLLCVALAVGHTTVGVVWVLPHLTQDQLPDTPFGRSSMTQAMIRTTWYIVTIFVLTIGGILLTLAWGPSAEARLITLRWLAAGWLVATGMAVWVAAVRVRKVKDLLRLPVPAVWVVVAALCWWAS